MSCLKKPWEAAFDPQVNAAGCRAIGLAPFTRRIEKSCWLRLGTGLLQAICWCTSLCRSIQNLWSVPCFLPSLLMTPLHRLKAALFAFTLERSGTADQ